MGGVHRDDLVWDMDCAPEQEQVTLRWKGGDSYERVEISVERLPGCERILKQALPATPAEYRLQLQTGETYLLSLRGFRRSSWQEAPQNWNLSVLSASQVEGLRSLEKEATPVELCFQYSQLGLTSRARQLAASLLEQYPEQECLRALARP